MDTLTDWLRRWGPSLLVMALIFRASATPGNDLPDFGVLDFVLKKGAHMLGYALLGACFVRGLANPSRTVRRMWLLAVALAGLYAMSDEFHQAYTSGRNSSWIDVGIDVTGAFLGAWIWTRLKRIRRT